MTAVLNQDGLDKLFRLKLDKKLHELPDGFREQARDYVKAMWKWPDRTFEISKIKRIDAIHEVEFKIRYIMEGLE